MKNQSYLEVHRHWYAAYQEVTGHDYTSYQAESLGRVDDRARITREVSEVFHRRLREAGIEVEGA